MIVGNRNYRAEIGSIRLRSNWNICSIDRTNWHDGSVSARLSKQTANTKGREAHDRTRQYEKRL
jgi:hypothetical protein